jgi:hypothetical protein
MTKDGEIALQAIYTYFRERGGRWPTFAYFEHWLNRYRKQDAILVIERIPRALLKPPAFAGGRPDPAGRLVLTAAGVGRCLGSDDDTQNLVAAVQCLLRHYTNYDLPDYPAAGEVPISPKQLADELNLPLLSDPHSISRLIALLEGEGLVVKNEHS